MNSPNNIFVKFGLWLLSKIVKQNGSYGLFGDIEEIYNYRKSKVNSVQNFIWLHGQIFSVIKDYIINLHYWGISMFLNYIKVAFRNLAKQKVNSFINILGLSIGIAMSILIILFVSNEYSMDKFHDNVENIYKIGVKKYGSEYVEKISVSTPNPLREIVVEEFPQIEYSTRIIRSDDAMISIDDNSFLETVYFVDPQFFDLFSYPVLLSTSQNPLEEFSSVAISEEIANKYFGSSNAIGKTINLMLGEEKYSFLVSTIIDDKSENSSFKPTIMVSFLWFKKLFPQDWAWSFNSNFGETFIKLKEGTDFNSFYTSIQSLEKHFPSNTKKTEILLLSYKDIHHDTELGSEIMGVTDEKYIFLLIGLGLLVLIIASINFMTLSVGRSVKRAKEVGVRKVIGAYQNQLVNQYLSESVLTSFISLFLGSILALLILPMFNELSNKSLSFKFDPILIGVIILLTLLLGILSGGYPAFILSAFKPTKVLKGALKLNGKNNFSRVLVVLQFSVSIFLIVSTLIVREQLTYMQEKDLGFDKEKLIEVSLNSPQSEKKSVEKYISLQNKILEQSNIGGVGAALNQFGIRWTRLKTQDEKKISHKYFYNMIDFDYIQTLGLKIVEGRNFSKEYVSDFSEAVIVNEAFVKKYGWENAIGQKIPGDFDNDPKIIGVVKDFNYSSLHDKIEPLILSISFGAINGRHHTMSTNWPPVYNYALISAGKGAFNPVLENIKNIWDDFYPEDPFVFKFVDERLQKQYEAELRIGKIINVSSMVAIIIAALGLFGLATIATENRIKEIGIRKVLGAKIGSIVYLVSKELVLLVIFANLLAWPVAYYALDSWLQNFAYKIDISILFFLASGIIAVAIAIATISYHAVRAANINPAKSLKYE